MKNDLTKKYAILMLLFLISYIALCCIAFMGTWSSFAFAIIGAGIILSAIAFVYLVYTYPQTEKKTKKETGAI